MVLQSFTCITFCLQKLKKRKIFLNIDLLLSSYIFSIQRCYSKWPHKSTYKTSNGCFDVQNKCFHINNDNLPVTYQLQILASPSIFSNPQTIFFINIILKYSELIWLVIYATLHVSFILKHVSSSASAFWSINFTTNMFSLNFLSHINFQFSS